MRLARALKEEMAPATKSAVGYRKAILHEVFTIEFIHLNNNIIYRETCVLTRIKN